MKRIQTIKTVVGVACSGLLVLASIQFVGAAHADAEKCPALIGIGVLNQLDSSGTEPTTVGSGYLGALFDNVKGTLDGAEDTRGQLSTIYVPYVKPRQDVEKFGDIIDTTAVTLETTAKTKLAECPTSRLFVTGYTQGAAAASEWLAKVGSRKSAVPPAAIAGAALFSNPTRPVGAAVFPGTTNTTPKAVPDTKGEHIAGIEEASVTPPDGGGSTPAKKADYGALSGLVADFCSAGDLTCDIPENSELARAVISVSEGSETAPGDPVAAASSIADALSWTGYKAAADIATNDFDTSKTTIKYTPKKSISSRVAEAANVRKAAPDPGDVLAQMATIGIGAAMTIAEDVLTPETIAAVATAGLANPAAGLAVLGAKAALSAVKIIAPTGSQSSRAVFQTVEKEMKDNVGLVKLATSVKYWNAAKAHGGYATTAATPTGASAQVVTAQWMTAAVGDLLASEQKPVTIKGAVSSSSRPTTTTKSSASSTTAPSTSVHTSSVVTSISESSTMTSPRWTPPTASASSTSSTTSPSAEPTDSR